MCLHHFRILDPKFDRKRQPQQNKALRGIQPVDDPTLEPIPSEKHCQLEVLNIVSLDFGGDTLLLRCQADWQSALPGSV